MYDAMVWEFGETIRIENAISKNEKRLTRDGKERIKNEYHKERGDNVNEMYLGQFKCEWGAYNL